MQLQPFFAECVLPPTIKGLFAAERSRFNNFPDLIENMVARDGVEPPTPAFSGPKLTVIAST